ncbi:hypothetical protein MJO47_14645 [Desulfuromonas sp. KJ2020]|uniref:hypothetical protein n=1 Tax=Desulfuromonas sp. KJ2020 TaxID=2919173 RepID=UPI0020A7C58F|nr:hypothetical protein [Desulfuromonas sp. KJ2020]MCP3178341.1 hypothetical protein [Desulfuromonas sp. KJ2020]
MKTFKRYMFWSLIFFFGFIAGALVTSLLEREVRPTFVKLIRSGLKTEQEFLAAKAARENRKFEAVTHRWVAVNAESDDGFRIFRDDQTYYNDESIFFPFALLVFKNMNSTESVIKGQKIVEGIDRGKLAVALEEIGQNELAQKEWGKAQSLKNNQPIEDIKRSTYLLLEQEKSDLHLSAERAVLGNDK